MTQKLWGSGFSSKTVAVITGPPRGTGLLGVTPGVGSLPRTGLSLSSQVEFR